MSGPVQNPANQKIWGADINVPARPVAPATKGYDALIANRNGRSYDRANGQISNATFKWPLFITDISIDFSVQGSTAQSQLTRDFYPHNFVQPGFTVTGISLDNVDYGQMCDFIHMCQIGMIQQFSESNLIQLQIAHRGIPALDTTIVNGVKVVENRGTFTADGSSNAVTRTVNGVEQITGQSWEPTSGRKVQSISANGKTVKTGYNQSIRGPHKEIIAMGVIGSIQRIHQTAVPNPTWTFQFQVFRMIKGPYREGPTKAGSGNFKTWVDLLDSGLAEPGSISSTDAMKKENAALLAKTLKDSANIFNTTSGHGSYTPGGQSNGSGSGGSGGSNPGAGGQQFTMYDGISGEIANMPHNPPAVASYIDNLEGFSEISGIWPNAARMSITVVSPGHDADCIDIEGGGCTNNDLLSWIQAAIKRGVDRPCIYTTKSNWDAVKAIMGGSGIPRSQYRYWIADWAGTGAHLLDGSDATQWTDGAQYDTSLCASDFLGGAAGTGTSASPTSTMTALYNYALNHNSGTSGGHCLNYVQNYLEATGAPGVKVPRLNWAWDFAVWCDGGTTTNGNSGSAASVGLKKLSTTNPYDAPQGTICVIPHPATGTLNPGNGQPNYAGDISIASGSGQFINDGPTESYGGSAAAWSAGGYNAALYVPTSYGGN